MVKLSTLVFVAFSSLAVAQRNGGSWDQWKDMCNKPENKQYCQQWIEWVRGGQQGRSPDQAPTAQQTRPRSSSPKTIITPQAQAPWQPPPEQSQPPPWQIQTWPTPSPTYSPKPSKTTQNMPPPTPAPQQGSLQPFQQAVCTVEIYSFTTRPEGQRTRTRTRTIIAPYVSTITSFLTTETTSIAVETIVQEQREQTITSSQTICN